MSSITAFISNVNGSIVNGGANFTFPIDEIYIIQSGSGSTINHQGNRYFTTTAVASLTGTGLVVATALAVNGSLQPSSIKISFPSSKAEVIGSNLFGSNSAVTFFGNTYYVSETQAEILAAANTTTGGGAASPTLPILVAPNDTQWVLSITNTGALVTEQLVNTVGTSALTSITLTAPDNAKWQVSVNNSGALVTTVI